MLKEVVDVKSVMIHTFDIEDRIEQFESHPDDTSVDISYVLFGGFMIKDLNYS